MILCGGRFATSRSAAQVRAADPEERLQLIDHSLLLLGPGTAASKAGHRRHQLVDIRSGGLDLTVPESVLQELPCLRRLEFFLPNDLGQFLFPFRRHKTVPLGHHIIHIIDTGNKGLDELLLAPQFGAGIHRLLYGDQDLLVITVGIVVLLHQHQDIVDIDLDLADQLDLKDDVIRNILFLSLEALGPLIP